ncbi:hypothetical protein WR25_03324 [Diploscapter pachys]|uniref:Protein kinase domain-containing protein n=1 Tax=Diploscapter pachys TaxID=2018661 RepID=A0A2A2L3M6_9BILA|nr:hypothetical protein WR25_03324 [Diploscapter pachys]
MAVLMLNHTATFLQENSVSGDKGSIIYFMTDFGCDDLCHDELLSAQSDLLETIYETNTHIRLFYSGTNTISEYHPKSKNDVESACKPYDNPTLQILGIIVGILCFLAIIMGIIMRCYYKCTNGRHIFVDLFKLTPCYKKKKREGIIGSMALQNRNAISAENYYYEMQLGGRPSEWEIDPNNLLVVETKPLGSGAFAKVYEGIFKGEIPLSKIVGHHLGIKMEEDGTYRVAVKKLPPYANSEAINDFRHEIAFMKQLGYHAHILSLLGCVTESTEPMILTEICPHGDVLSFVRSRKDNLIEEDSNYYFENGLKIKDLISIAWQTADGMTYLSTKNIVHRDIAARNVLLTESMVAKIADFGLCRLVDQALYTSKGGRLPIKWMALESLKYYEYTLQSDVWSFGVFLFELFSLGETPYATVQPTDMPDYLESGKRLPKPEKCPEKIYQMMTECWKVESDTRPKIEEIREDLSKLLTSATEAYGYLDIEAQRQTSFVDEGEICGIPADIFEQRQEKSKIFQAILEQSHKRLKKAQYVLEQNQVELKTV